MTAAAALVLAGCATVRPGPAGPPVGTTRLEQDRLLKAAEQSLVVDCLGARGLTLPSRARAPAENRRLQAALFGSDPRELSLTLTSGFTVTANSDGCVATARASLYGDQTRWFHAQVTVDNLRAEAQARMKDDPAHRAALDRWSGDDGWWESRIADTDSSWANHGISGPGIKDYVQVYESAWQGGAMTICLAPGQEVGYNGAANDRGDSHIWATGC